MSEPKDFQRATAERIAAIFAEGKQRRVLLADEVGLGKTIMARQVIDKVRVLRKSVNDDMYRVVYICSNMNIVNQNIEHLGIKEKMNTSESRLSMQHLKLEEMMHKLKDENLYGEGKMPELLIPLTPGTSFSLTTGIGNLPERALMYSILCEMPEFSAMKDVFYKIFKGAANVTQKSWEWYIHSYGNRVRHCGSDYIDRMMQSLRVQPDFNESKELLLSSWQNERWNLISRFRIMFANISLEQLEPDLVIMDEFQRFSSLLNNQDDNEQSLIARKFFGDLDNANGPLILLLSATPYKPYTTLEELNEYNSDAQYEDFTQLMDFLFRTSTGTAKFKTVWDDYSNELCHLSSDNIEVLIAKKKNAENKMYEAMCRTERLNDGLIDSSGVKEVKISDGDIVSYIQMQQILADCRNKIEQQKHIHFRSFNVPVDYIKSSPYLLSFMDNYVLKKNIATMYKNQKLPLSNRHRLLLKSEHVYRYKEIEPNNARLDALKKILFTNHSERLLWVPASHPYYSTSQTNVFEINRNFSKILVFSAWGMVPRMLATMLSFESERLTIGKAFDDATYLNLTGGNRIRSGSEQWLTYPCLKLAELYNPEDYFGWSIDKIRKDIENKLKLLLGDLPLSGQRCSDMQIYNLMRWIDGKDVTVENIPIRAISILANFAIGAPAICLYRLLKDVNQAQQVAENFVALFNRRQSAAVIDLIYERKSQDIYYEQVVDYCVMGNLQSVLDEFAHVVDSPNLFERLNDSFSRISTLDIDNTDSFAKDGKKKMSMRTHYSVAYYKTKSDDESVQRTDMIRSAFNSPFRPFVLTTTSVGQEGLDFHLYCRKIVHWNIPSNPQDLEQREGRINRYKCLAIRRNIAHLYHDRFSWEAMFKSAESDFKATGKYSEIVPYWCLPKSFLEERGVVPEMIERIIPQYPMSLDVAQYNHLKEVLSLYRLTMGQPRQEELLELLNINLSDEQIQELLFDLSPFSKLKKAVNSEPHSPLNPSTS